MKIYKLILVITGAIIIYAPTVLAWDVEFGYRRLMPRIGAGTQEYLDENKNRADIHPTVENTAIGQSYLLGIKFGNLSLDFEKSEYTYLSTLPSDSNLVTADTEIENTITEQRVGINYHIERELAGVFAGLGFTEFKERLASDSDEWTYKTTTPYFKFGFDLILGAWIARYEQVHFEAGEHTIRVNSFGILFKI